MAPAMGEEITRRLARFAKAQPRNAQAQFHYAMSLWKGQPAGSPSPDLRQVEGLLRRAVTLDVKFAKAFLELGILLSDQQRYTEAIQELRQATRLAPDLAQAHYRLSQAYSTDRPAGAGGRARAVPTPQWLARTLAVGVFWDRCSGPRRSHVRPWRIMISAIFVRSVAPPPADFIHLGDLTEILRPDRGRCDHTVRTSWLPLLSESVSGSAPGMQRAWPGLTSIGLPSMVQVDTPSTP